MAKKNIAGTVTTVVLLILLAVFCLFVYNKFIKGNEEDLMDKIEEVKDEIQEEVSDSTTVDEPKTEPEEETKYTYLKDYYPKTALGQTIRHRFYGFEYSEKDEQAKWVAYELTRSKVTNYSVKRTDDFREDPLVRTGSATLDDYRRSGYDRGHLCAAADMSFSKQAMSETFYMSNMSPQDKSFNRGVWRELEEQVRDWAIANKKLYVVTGPVLKKRETKKIGQNKVTVPSAYYKALLDLSEPEQKAIAFVIPNKKQSAPLDEFAMSVDELEKITGLDFYHHLPDAQEESLEGSFNPSRWMYDEERYQKRLSTWNHQ